MLIVKDEGLTRIHRCAGCPRSRIRATNRLSPSGPQTTLRKRPRKPGIARPRLQITLTKCRCHRQDHAQAVFPVNPSPTLTPPQPTHSKPNKKFPKFAGYFQHFARLVPSCVVLLQRRTGGSKECRRGLRQALNRPSFFHWTICTNRLESPNKALLSLSFGRIWPATPMLSSAWSQ